MFGIAGAFLAVLVAVLFRSSKIGRLSMATREDELAAGAMGIEVFTPRLVAFVVSGGLVAFGGKRMVYGGFTPIVTEG